MSHTYSADNTALLIVDPYNDFMSEGGKLNGMIQATAEEIDFYAHLRQIIPAARRNGLQVFVLPHRRPRADNDYAGWQFPNMFQQQTAPARAFEEGTWGGEFHSEFRPQDGDVVVTEHWAQSGLANTDLDFQLKQHGIEKIILVGVVANSCIESTGRYGMELGYHVTIVPDAAAAFDHDGLVAAAANAKMYAHAILNTEDLVAALERAWL